MVKLTTGERLDDEGNPIPGTGFEYESEGRVAELLAKRTSPLLYSSLQGEWVWMIPDDSSGENERCVAVCPTGNDGPPVHYHPSFEEHFKVVAGSWIVKADSKELTLNAGDDILAKRGMVHTYRCVGEEGGFGVMEIDIIPAIGFEGALRSIFGEQNDYNLNARRSLPPLLQIYVTFRDYRTRSGLRWTEFAIGVPPGKTVMTILNILSVVFAPFGRLLGYKAKYPHHYEDEFWEKLVVQPPK